MSRPDRPRANRPDERRTRVGTRAEGGGRFGVVECPAAEPAESLGARLSHALPIAANFLPVLGVLLLGWDALFVLLLYWIENVAIGAVTVLKILLARGRDGSVSRAERVTALIGFAMGYGFFTLVHGMFVFGFSRLFDRELEAPTAAAANADWAPGVVVALLVGSVLVEFVAAFLLRLEARARSPVAIAAEPMPRMFVMHLTIIFGGWALMAGSPTGLMAVLALLKTAAEVYLRRLTRRNVKAP